MWARLRFRCALLLDRLVLRMRTPLAIDCDKWLRERNRAQDEAREHMANYRRLAEEHATLVAREQVEADLIRSRGLEPVVDAELAAALKELT